MPRRGGTVPDAALNAGSVCRQCAATLRSIRSVKANPAPSQPHDGGSLLVVDDNQSNRALLKLLLSAQGYTVAVAENGRRALDLLQAKRFDLVILDIMLPEMNGYQVLQRMKAHEKHRHPSWLNKRSFRVVGIIRAQREPALERR